MNGLFTKLRSFCLPGGDAQARTIRAIRTTQRGRMRSSPDAKWIPFTADETIESTRSDFRWQARIGGSRFGFVTVTDAYEEGHGRLAVKLGGIIPARNVTGPDADRGELQRYLAEIISCPAALVNHAALDWTATGPNILRVRDRNDLTGATVDFVIADDGRPLDCTAERPRTVGKQSIPTPWAGRATDFREFEGMLLPYRLAAEWRLPEGPFVYFESEVTSLEIIR